MNNNIERAFAVYAPPETKKRVRDLVGVDPDSNGFCFGYRMMPHSVAEAHFLNFRRSLKPWSEEWQRDWIVGFYARLEDTK